MPYFLMCYTKLLLLASRKSFLKVAIHDKNKNSWHWYWPVLSWNKKDVYSINVTGYIPQQKSKEFKQHMRQLIGQQSEEAIEFSVLQDVINEDLFQVKVSFTDKESMFSFINSENYATISGSFRVLGMLREKFTVEYSDLKDENWSHTEINETRWRYFVTWRNIEIKDWINYQNRY